MLRGKGFEKSYKPFGNNFGRIPPHELLCSLQRGFDVLASLKYLFKDLPQVAIFDNLPVEGLKEVGIIGQDGTASSQTEVSR